MEWIHDDKNIGTNNDGGSRKTEMHKESKKADILGEAKTIFFLMVNQKVYIFTVISNMQNIRFRAD